MSAATLDDTGLELPVEAEEFLTWLAREQLGIR